MITILADTSALISLEIKGLVSQASKLIRFIISKVVYGELGGIAKFEDVHNMIKKILLMAIVLIGLVLSGCIEDSVRIADDNNTTDAPANVTDNVTANVSEPVESRSVSIPLERPPFIEDG